MVRANWLLTIGVALALAGGASAQIPTPKIEGLPPDLQKQLQEAFQRAGQGMPGGGARGVQGARWGGLRLEKPSPELRAQLGLDEKEALVVAGVDKNSLGDKAGVKANDVLLKIGKQAVPSDLTEFAKLVKEQKSNEPTDLVVIRKGKEETIKSAKMPVVVQNVGGGAGGLGGIGGAGGFGGGGIGGAGGFGGIGGFPANPFLPGKLTKLHMEFDVNGGKLVKDQDGDKFSGEFSKDDLKIAVNGTLENGLPKIGEITVREGKEAKKYTSPRDVPAQHRAMVQQLLPSPFTGLMTMPMMPLMPDLPLFPGLDK